MATKIPRLRNYNPELSFVPASFMSTDEEEEEESRPNSPAEPEQKVPDLAEAQPEGNQVKAQEEAKDKKEDDNKARSSKYNHHELIFDDFPLFTSGRQHEAEQKLKEKCRRTLNGLLEMKKEIEDKGAEADDENENDNETEEPKTLGSLCWDFEWEKDLYKERRCEIEEANPPYYGIRCIMTNEPPRRYYHQTFAGTPDQPPPSYLGHGSDDELVFPIEY